jgi:hypothetical protein
MHAAARGKGPPTPSRPTSARTGTRPHAFLLMQHAVQPVPSGSAWPHACARAHSLDPPVPPRSNEPPSGQTSPTSQRVRRVVLTRRDVARFPTILSTRTSAPLALLPPSPPGDGRVTGRSQRSATRPRRAAAARGSERSWSSATMTRACGPARCRVRGIARRGPSPNPQRVHHRSHSHPLDRHGIIHGSSKRSDRLRPRIAHSAGPERVPDAPQDLLVQPATAQARSGGPAPFPRADRSAMCYMSQASAYVPPGPYVNDGGHPAAQGGHHDGAIPEAAIRAIRGPPGPPRSRMCWYSTL